MVMKLHIFTIKKFQVDSHRTYLAGISLDSAFNKAGKRYPQIFLEESKYIEKKVIRRINDNLSNFFLF